MSIFIYTFRASDPVSVALAMRESRNHVSVYTTRGPEFRDGGFIGAVAGSPYRAWPVSTLVATVNRLPGVASRVEISAEQIAAAVTDYTDAISRLFGYARAAQGALSGSATAAAGAARVPTVDDVVPDVTIDASTKLILGIVVVGALVLAYVFREPIAGFAKSGAEFMAAQAATATKAAKAVKG